MKKKKKRKGIKDRAMRCPYCGSTVIYRSAEGIYRDNSRGTMLYVCSHYPECDAYVRTHPGTKIPVGTMANHELRNLRNTAHHYFGRLYHSGMMTKQEAYLWLADNAAVSYDSRYWKDPYVRREDVVAKVMGV